MTLNSKPAKQGVRIATIPMSKVTLFLTVCCVVLNSQFVQAQSARELEQKTNAALAEANLTADQKSQISGLAQLYGPQIDQADKDASLTSDQKIARTVAIERAIAASKRGAEAVARIDEAIEVLPLQRSAFTLSLQLRAKFYAAIDELLTNAQKQSELLVTEDEAGVTGYIVIRFVPEAVHDNGDAKSLLELARQANLDSLVKVLEEFGLVKSERAVSPTLLKAINPRHARLLKRIASYWRIDASRNAAEIETIIKRLNALPEVDTAYAELNLTSPSTPSVDPSDDPYAFRQAYLDPSPVGIDAKYAWTKQNGLGAEVGLIDLECSWNMYHEDLASPSMQLGFGDIRPGDHGTAVVGEIAAIDNSLGCIGIAPSTEYVLLTSWYDLSGSSEHIAPAIIAVLPIVYAGDVLLLEVERNGKPVEIDDLDFDAIQLAVAEGLVVVEAAGNGGVNLDTYQLGSKRILNRLSPDFRDSGAIMVGAANPREANNRLAFSCYGNRLDCFAWGKFVTTTGYGYLDPGGGDPNRTYTHRFHGTSSASPIIAGAAIILQGMSVLNNSRVLSSVEMRSILADPITGTAQGTSVPGYIGFMPDLRSIIENNSLGGYYCVVPALKNRTGD